MKKFDIKKLLVLVLAFVLVFALVACNDGGTDSGTDDGGKTDSGKKPVKPVPTPSAGQVTTADFFEKLWNGASVIGSEEIGEKDDIGLELSLSLGVTNKDNEIIDLGIDVYAILDRDTNANTAAKVKIHDLTGTTDNNWLTIYYFLNDPYVGYIDWSYGDTVAQFKVGFDAGFNATWAEAIDSFLGKEVLNKMSVDDIITSFTEDMGSSWGLTGLIDSITGLFNLDLNKLLSSISFILPEGASLDDGVLALLMSLGGMLTGEDANNGVYPCTTKADGDNTIYSAPLDAVWGFVPMLLGNSGKDYYVDKNGNGKVDTEDTEFAYHEDSHIGTMIGDLSLAKLELQYTLDKNDKLNGAAINVGIALDDDAEETFEIGININSLRFHNLGTVTVASAQSTLGIDPDNYADYFEFDLALSAKLENNALVMGDFDFDGTYGIELKGCIDLLNHTGNKTALQAVVTYNNAAIVKATYGATAGSDKYGEIVLTVDNTVKFTDGGKQSVVESFGNYVMPMIVKALVGSDVYYVDANGNNAYDKGEEENVTKDTEGAVKVFVKNSTALQDAALALANVLYSETFATADDIVAEGAKFTYDTANFHGAIIKQIDLVDLFTSLFGGEPSYAASAADAKDETKYASKDGTYSDKDTDGNYVWIASIQKIVIAVSNALSRTADGEVVVNLDAEEVLTSIFADGHGPTTLDQFVFGSTSKKIGGLFTAENEEWIANTFKGSAWVETDNSITNLLSSIVKITVSDAPKVAIEVTCGDAKISLGLTASITAEENAPTYEAAKYSESISEYFTEGQYQFSDTDGNWVLLYIAREAAPAEVAE